MNTNARSLCPKLTSLLDNKEETEADQSVVSDKWFKDGDGLTDIKDDLREGSGMEMICSNRETSDRGVAHGGIAVIYKKRVR